MRNHITPDHAAWPNASQHARFASSVAVSNQRLELVRDDHAEQAAKTNTEHQGTAVPASDFEGFGSFS